MFLALEHSTTALGADMFQLDAARLVTFVLSARLELCAFLLAAYVGAGQVLA